MKKPLNVVDDINTLGLWDEASNGRFKLSSHTTWKFEYIREGNIIDKIELPYEKDEEIKAFSHGFLLNERYHKELVDQSKR